MIKILVAYILDLCRFDRINRECQCFRSEHESDNPVPRVLSRVCVNKCTTQGPFSNNELCRFHIRQSVRVGTVEPISLNTKWASDTFAYRNLSQKPLGYLCVKKLIYSEGTLQHYLLLLFNICLVLINFSNSGLTYIRCSKWKVYVGWVSQSSDVS